MAGAIDHAAPRDLAPEVDGRYLVRPIPNDDVYFFEKTIDNSRVIRQADPTAGRACWKVIGTTLAGSVLMIALLLPTLYSLLAGYQIEALRQERQRLENELAALDFAEAKLISPERLEALARMQQFVDPAPQSVVYLEGKEGKLARR
jgi:hypothetical protein